MVDVDQDIIIMATMESITMAIGLTSMIATLMQDAVSHVSITSSLFQGLPGILQIKSHS